MESKLILAFHVAPQKLGKIRFCAMKMGMRVMDVPLADCGQTLGALCGKRSVKRMQPRRKMLSAAKCSTSRSRNCRWWNAS